jgi:hypothetical protein
MTELMTDSPLNCPICKGWLEPKRDGTMPLICEYCKVFEIRLTYFLNALFKPKENKRLIY